MFKLNIMLGLQRSRAPAKAKPAEEPKCTSDAMDLDVQTTKVDDDFQEEGGIKKKGVWPEHAHDYVYVLYMRV